MRLAGAALGLAVVLAECGDSEPPDEAAPPVQSGQSTTVTYCHDETARITEPDHLGAAAPAAVYLHGGSWIGRTTPAVASSSTTSASPSTNRTSSLWRPTTGSSPEELWPAQIVDAKCAVRYLRANAKALRVDPREIGVWGHSAGDHLASLAGTGRRPRGAVRPGRSGGRGPSGPGQGELRVAPRGRPGERTAGSPQGRQPHHLALARRPALPHRPRRQRRHRPPGAVGGAGRRGRSRTRALHPRRRPRRRPLPRRTGRPTGPEGD